MNQTTNYQLNQWDPDDKVLRTDFNADNAKLDAALHALDGQKADRSEVETLETQLGQYAKITLGTYTGNGAASQTISLGGKPRAVLVMESNGSLSDPMTGRYYGGLALEDQPTESSRTTIVSVTEQGFAVYYNSDARVYTNSADTKYVYLAVF